MPYAPGTRPSRAKPGAKRGPPFRKDRAAAAALDALATGAATTSAEAAEIAGVSPRTVDRARLAAEAAPTPRPLAKASPVPHVAPALPAPEPPAPAGTVPLDRAVLAQLLDRLPSLPPAQQEQLAAALPVVATVRAAVSRGLAPHRAAAAAVSRELRGLA